MTAAALALFVLAPSALAAKSVVNTLGSTSAGATGGLFNTPVGVAVNSTGNGSVPQGTFYVVDSGNRRIQQFRPNGEFAAAFGANVGGVGVNVCTAAPTCVAGASGSAAGQLGGSGAQGIGIDQATGTIYVSDIANRRIDVFSATGAFEGAFGWGAIDGTAAFQYCTTTCHAPGTAAPASGNVPGGQFGAGIGGLAVDGSGKVYVANMTSRRIDVFTPTFASGVVTAVAFTRSFGWGALTGASSFEVCEAPTTCHAPAPAGNGLGQFGASSPTDVVLDPSGNAYALDAANKRIQKFDSTPAPIAAPTFDASAAITSIFGTGSLYGLAFDPAANHLYVSGSNSASSSQVRVAELGSTGAAIAGGVHGADLTVTSASGLAVAPASLGGNVLLSSTSNGQRVFALNERPLQNPVTTFGATTATFTGTVVSNASPVTYHFEYSTDGVSWTKAPAADVNVPATLGTVAVSQKVTGLSSGQLYRVRLVQTLPVSGMPATSLETTFTTQGPIITGTAVSSTGVTPTSATVSANINPNGQGTAYHVEYVTQTQFEQSGFAGASVFPTGVNGIGNGTSAVAVSPQLPGLSPATKYHFRFVASNDAATATGPELVFATFPSLPVFSACANDGFRTGPSAALPDCRAYEQATPTDKHGGSVNGDANLVQAARSGAAVTFDDTSGLSTAGGGSTTPPVYAATRGADSWSTDDLLPVAGPAFLARVLGWDEELKVGVSFVPGDAGNSLYYTRISSSSYEPAVGVPSALSESYRIQDYAADGSHLILDSPEVLAPGGVAGKHNLYELNQGAFGLVGRIPISPAPSCDDGGGPACVPASGSFAGGYDWQGSNLNQGIGYTKSTNTISDDGSKIFFTAGEIGQIFMRENGTRTVQVSASQRTTPDPNGHKPAAFLAATPSGSKVFFASCEKLTNDSTAVSTAANTCTTSSQGQDLYEYDTASGQLTDLTVDSNAGDPRRAGVAGFLGASEDGAYVYFVAGGVLAGGASSLGCPISAASGAFCNLYVSHAGATTFIASLNDSNSLPRSDPDNWRTRDTGAGSGVVLPKTSRVSANGTLILTSRQSLTGYSNGNAREIFRYQPGNPALTCVSCNPTGLAPHGEAKLETTSTDGGEDRSSFTSSDGLTSILTRNISADGKRVFFDSVDNLSPADVNGVSDVYEWEAKGSGSCDESGVGGGCLYLLSSGTSPAPSYYGDSSESGADAFVFTFQPLVPQDEDQVNDVYDARVVGGLASQHPAAASAPCEGEACREGGTSAPAASGAGTASFQGPGNQPVKQHRKKHHRKRHHKQSHKQGGGNRGGNR